MDEKAEQFQGIEDSLAEGIAAVMAADRELAEPEDLTDLYLGELNRLWIETAPEQSA